MKLVNVGAGALNQTPLDWEGNRARIERAIAMARAAGVTLLCLPELCVTGYGCEDAFFSPSVLDTAWAMLEAIAPLTRGLAVAVGLPVAYGNGIFNTACLLVDGVIAGFSTKKFLPGDGVHYEPRWFKPWPVGVLGELICEERCYPFGDVIFDLGGVRVGFEICEDGWAPRRPGVEQAFRGVDVILNLSASHFAFGKHEVRKRLVQEGSRAFCVAYVYANALGLEAGRVLYDGDTLIAAGGELLAVGPRFSFKDMGLSSAVVDIEACRLARRRNASFGGVTDPAGCVRLNFTWPILSSEDQLAPAPKAMGWEASLALKFEEFTRAVALGLFDYLRKSRSRGFVLSLSGGADSGAIATLVYLMSCLGVEELGLEAYTAKLGLESVPAPDKVKEQARTLTNRLLLCAYQGTRYSGSVTRQAARALAEAVGAVFHELDVDALLTGYLALGEGVIGRPLNWEQDDLAMQNLQARVRSPGIWLLANLRNALLLTTGNRSEAAVGYATMDGDTSGGLAPLGGIDKAFLREWLRWMERSGPEGIGPLPALLAINEQAPTAELRPADRGQTDEGDLMPYPVLDAIERAAIRDKKPPLEVYHLMRARFKGLYADLALAGWVERFYVLWSRNQWKRERYAPAFHLDDESLDPKTWCRFPILSGNFELELAALRQAL